MSRQKLRRPLASKHPATLGRASFIAGVLALLGWGLLMLRRESLGAWLILADHGWRLLLALTILAPAWGIGLALEGILVRRSPAARRFARIGATAWTLPLALGLAWTSWAILALGCAGAATRSGLTLLLLAQAGAGFVIVRTRPAEALRRFWSASEASRASKVSGGWTLALGAFWGAFFLQTLTPPAAYDVLEYHLAGPLAWVEAGRLTPLAGNFYTALPSGLEAVYMMPLAAGGQIDGAAAAKLIHFAALLAWLAMAARLFRTLGVRSASLRAAGALTLLAFPATFLSASDANNDLAAALFFGLAFLALAEGWGAGRAGLLAGLGWGFKVSMLTVGLGPLAVALLFLGLASPKRRFLQTGLDLMAFGAGALLGFLPWMLRAWLATGCPLFPSTLFCSESQNALVWSPDLAREYLAVHLAKMPWESAYWAQWLARLGEWGWGYVLALAAGLMQGVRGWVRARDVAARPQELRIGAAALACLAGTAAWSLLGTSPQRFLLPLMPLAVGCGLASVEGLARMAASRWAIERSRLTAALAVGLALATVPQLLSMLLALDQYGAMEAIARPGDPWRYQKQFLQGWDQAPFVEYLAAESVKADEANAAPVRVFLLYEARSAHLPVPSATVTVHDAFPPEWESLEKLREAGFTHLLVNELELERLREFYPVKPEHRARRVGERSQLPPPRSPRATPGSVEFYVDWLPWSGPARHEIAPNKLLPFLASELPGVRDKAVVVARGMTEADHRVWLFDLRR